MPRNNKRFSEQLREMNQALLLSSIRHDELADQYRHAMLALAEQDRMKDEFLAMLSHELRNPLAPIANAVQLLGMVEDESQLQREARSIIERQTALLSRLVDDLMEISRIRSGRVSLRLQYVEMNDIIARAVQSTRPLLQRHHHHLIPVPPHHEVWVNADPARLEQVVVNLLNNAAKYTPDGGIITLSLQVTNDQCIIGVRDTGIGIAPELLPRIFDIFTQADRSLDRSQGGLGIGLALVQRLVQLHHGSVEVQSEVGNGSEFTVYLPLAEQRRDDERATPTRQAAARGDHALRVLVVDDNVDAAQSLSILLTTLGHEVRTAYDGRDAIALASAFAPDAAILDLGLPEIDGFEVAQRIRQQPENRNILLIAVSGYGRSTDFQRSANAGLDHHLIKPTDYQQIQALLATIVR